MLAFTLYPSRSIATPAILNLAMLLVSHAHPLCRSSGAVQRTVVNLSDFVPICSLSSYALGHESQMTLDSVSRCCVITIS